MLIYKENNLDLILCPHKKYEIERKLKTRNNLFYFFKLSTTTR